MEYASRPAMRVDESSEVDGKRSVSDSVLFYI